MRLRDKVNLITGATALRRCLPAGALACWAIPSDLDGDSDNVGRRDQAKKSILGKGSWRDGDTLFNDAIL